MTPRVVEIAGVAGAGKTTLALHLARDRGTQIGIEPGRLRLAAGIASAAPALVPARITAPGRAWTTAELRSIAYLYAWRSALLHDPSGGLQLLDHGPAFRLASLAACGPPMSRTPPFRRWWRATGQNWSRVLDAVIWLDAPDEVLRSRIDARDRDHPIRRAGSVEATRFLTGYRQAFQSVLDLLSSLGTRVVVLDSAEESPDVLADRVRADLEAWAPGRPG